MRRALLIFSIHCVVGAGILHAQEWVKTTPTFDPPGNYGVFYWSFVDSRNGWLAAGPNASVWRTTDGGRLWRELAEGIALDRIEFEDTLHGWIFGRNLPGNTYSMLITKDGGLSWSNLSVPEVYSLTFLDSLNGLAGGDDTIYATTNGGITWMPQEIAPYTRCGVSDIFFADKNNAWAVGGSSEWSDAGIILNTIDGGKHWKVNSHPTLGVNWRECFTDTLHGYVVGSGVGSFGGAISVTSDGGVTWKFHALASPWLNDVAFANDSTGWAIGEGGFIWKTTDRGLNWSKVESGTTATLSRIFFFDHGQLGYIFGTNQTLLVYDATNDVRHQQVSPKPSFHLLQNYPNPFNPTTTISYQLPEAGFVTLKVFDVLGREVSTLVNGQVEAGYQTAVFDGSNFSSGLYLVRLTVRSADAKPYVNTIRMLLTK